ncbi:MAG: adenosylcobinamide-GDP ribazoletransferase [Sulfuricaulis sp.]|uniref:adenosylcobinamide-GDP ribazoletransferase n=1 Tax=Sulfuricaulis sp. TaxID=2003553 RepID=UPI0025D828F4|nr:adenosylcobinamide-GDP ribazoletransferase [Sulfuricaulis sp.]MCR4346816.1 adenosylcobinamide-GDP ribazoletransferase [Sulfuricaulis sp.]
MRYFWIALQFLTRLPAPRSTSASPEDRGRSVLFYPLVGFLLGALIAGMQALLTSADVGLQSALVLLLWVLLTGGLHLDGLADSADAWAGSHGDRDKALRIMKDTASGPAGVTAVVLVLLLKFAALSVLLRENVWMSLVMAPVLGRMAIVFLFASTPYVRMGGLGADHAMHLPRLAAIIVLILIAAAVIARGGIGLVALAAGLGLLLILRLMMVKRLGGATGDTLGAACELIEAAVLMAMALVVS